MRWTAGLLTLALMGCPEPPTAPIDIVGIYRLVSVNGVPVPCLIGGTTEVVHGAVEFHPALAFDRETTYRTTFDSQPPAAGHEEQAGTYTVASNGTVAMTWTARDGATLRMSGKVAGDAITLTVAGDAWAYQR